MEDSDQCSGTKAAGNTRELDLALSSLDISSKPAKLPTSKLLHPVQAPMANHSDSNSVESKFLKLQEANNISKAAYKEIMGMALEANTWVVGTPALGTIEEFQQIFKTLPPPGMRVECSVETAILPIAPENLVSVLMDVDRWGSTLSRIAHFGSSHLPTGVLQQLSRADETITKIVMVNAEFQLPTPLVPTRKFCFLRCLRKIVEDIWAIVDVSNDYFHHGPSDSKLEVKCRRRPSGVIIRRHDEYSEVIWLENVEVNEHQVQENIYSSIINSNLAFCAKRCVRTLLQKLKRNNSRFLNLRMPVDQQARAYLLNLTEYMEKNFLECINEAPNRRKWDILSDGEVRVLKDVTMNHVETQGSSNYIALTSFRIQAQPFLVVQFLLKNNVKLQWPSLLEEPEEVIKLASEDYNNCITLHKNVDLQNDFTKNHDYLLQEASWDEFCYFIISSPMTQAATNALFVGGCIYDHLKPSGFAILPDGSAGLLSDSCLVTIAMQQELAVLESGQAIQSMNFIINDIVEEIYEAMPSRLLTS
ncbi:homeobox-leucine zipper protein ROC2-like isoform X1 [Quercus lobata]|uniref:START domain-containing protein n=2 Tax=Quercus lobata TaxID=97700 RepID=A0A7N2MJZ9_QUELO|nr:homeobox-leucine zipper protein ROC2-like isoform X1 [Quercus lobata]